MEGAQTLLKVAVVFLQTHRTMTKDVLVVKAAFTVNLPNVHLNVTVVIGFVPMTVL